MPNPYLGVVITADTILLLASLILAVIVVLYAFAKESFDNRRLRFLKRLKNNVRSLAQSGQKPTGQTCPMVNMETAEQFLDVEMNRADVLFDKKEQLFVQNCFVQSDKIPVLRRSAARRGNKWRRIEAFLSLGYAGDAESLDTLKSALKENDSDISYFAMMAIGLMRSPEAAKILLEILRRQTYGVYKIVSILETFPPTVITEIVPLIKDPDAKIRFWALKLLSKFKAEAYLNEIVILTKDQSDDVRAAACECLGKLAKQEAKEVLKLCLDDPIWFVRMHALRALAAVAGSDAMQDIVRKLNDESFMVKESAKAAIVRHMDKALPYLEKILSGPDTVARREVVEALEISGKLTKS